MRVDLAHQLTERMPHVTLEAGGETWQVYVFGMTRIARDWFVQLALVGSGFCTATVRTPWSPDRDEVAAEIIDLLREWLEANHFSSQVYLESRQCALRPS